MGSKTLAIRQLCPVRDLVRPRRDSRENTMFNVLPRTSGVILRSRGVFDKDLYLMVVRACSPPVRTTEYRLETWIPWIP